MKKQGNGLELHYADELLLILEVDHFDDLDGLLRNRGFRGVHKLDIELHDRRQISGQSELDTKERSFRNHYAFK
ncbi:hypothetical protein YC2023_091782 [Brassica napus]